MASVTSSFRMSKELQRELSVPLRQTDCIRCLGNIAAEIINTGEAFPLSISFFKSAGISECDNSKENGSKGSYFFCQNCPPPTFESISASLTCSDKPS